VKARCGEVDLPLIADVSKRISEFAKEGRYCAQVVVLDEKLKNFCVRSKEDATRK